MAGNPSHSAGQRREAKYDITSKGFRVGELLTTSTPLQQDGKPAYRFTSTMDIEASFLFFSHRSSSREEALVGRDGTLTYRRDATENGKKYSVDGRLTEQGFVIRNSVDGSSRTISVSRKQYDYTTMDCPELHIQTVGGEATVRLLDLERGNVVKRHYRWVRNEEVRVGDRKVLCRVIDFTDPNNRCRRWISSDGLGVLIARQEGSGASGSYSLSIVSLVTAGPA
jgi:hypothetical protein